MEYDVFISYSRCDAALCDAVVRVVEGFDLKVFVDRHSIPGGAEWENELRRVLGGESRPAVIVLMTPASAESEWVGKEVELAGENACSIIPVKYDHAAEVAFRRQLGTVHHLDATGPTGTDPWSDDLRDRLWLALHAKLEPDLDQWLDKSARWAENLLDRCNGGDFWTGRWKPLFGDADRKVLLGPGGSGKSVLIALRVRELLDTGKSCPIVIEPARLRQGLDGIAQFLGAPSRGVVPEHLRLIEKHFDKRLVFVLDGLDTVGAPEGTDRPAPSDQIVETLAELARLADVLAGCRPEVWHARFAGHVGLVHVPVPPLEGSLLDRHLEGASHEILQRVPLLRLPLYLDLVVRYPDRELQEARSVTDFLRRLWDLTVEMPGDAEPCLRLEPGTLLEHLAELQLGSLQYEVPREDLETACRGEPGFANVLDHLKRQGLLDEKPSLRHTAVIRLRHDVLDAFGMVQLLVAPGGLARRQALYAKSAEPCGHQLLSTLVQVAEDEADRDLKEEVFCALLEMLDHKKFSNYDMDRAWAATYTLRSMLIPLLPLVLDCLDGEVAGSLDPAAPGPPGERCGSRLRPGPVCTQESASSLASAFAALAGGTAPEADRAVPVLVRGLDRYRLRRRFVEALAKYRHPEAVAALESLGEKEAGPGGDRGVLPSVAEALGPLRRASSLPVLEKIAQVPGIDGRTRRIAIEMQNKILPLSRRRPVPAIEDDEILQGLAVREQGTGRYTDWRDVQSYARHVAAQIRAGKPLSPRVLKALLGALEHDQTYTRVAVAECLGLVDDPGARDALLAELLEGSVLSDLRRVCLESLSAQLKRAGTAPHAQASRCVLVLAAEEAKRHPSLADVGAELENIACDPECPITHHRLLAGMAAEAVDPPGPGWDLLPRAFFRIVPEGDAPVDASVREFLDEAGDQPAGRGLETKYRLTRLERRGDGALAANVAETSWELGAGFHMAVRDPRNHPSPPLAIWRWVEEVLTGRPRLPGIAVVHGLLLTSDRKLLLTERSRRRVSYAPGHWSASFEEQITESDFACGDEAADRASRRGVEEEFGLVLPARRESVQVISALLELDSLNLGIVALVRPDVDAAAIEARWRTEPRPTHAWEAEQIRFIEASPETLRAASRGEAEALPQPLHPTSRLRMAMLARWLEKRGDA